MKIRVLQEKLSKFDPELEVICYCEDEESLVDGRMFVLFDVTDTSEVKAEKTRLDDGTPYLKFHEGSAQERLVTLVITSYF